MNERYKKAKRWRESHKKSELLKKRSKPYVSPSSRPSVMKQSANGISRQTSCEHYKRVAGKLSENKSFTIRITGMRRASQLPREYHKSR
jgi:hypothetical protein